MQGGPAGRQETRPRSLLLPGPVPVRRRDTHPGGVRGGEESAAVAVHRVRVGRAEGALSAERLVDDPLRAAAARAALAVHKADVDLVAKVAVVERVEQLVAGQRRRLEQGSMISVPKLTRRAVGRLDLFPQRY